MVGLGLHEVIEGFAGKLRPLVQMDGRMGFQLGGQLIS